MKFMNENMTVIVIALGALGCYQFLILSPVLRTWFLRKFGAANFSLSWHLFERLTGALLIGISSIICYLLGSESKILDHPFLLNRSVAWISIVSIILMITMAAASTAFAHGNAGYPQIKTGQWHLSLILVNALAWFAYLLPYEFLLRGILFSAFLTITGIAAAIMFNIVIYAAIHFHKPRKEMLGCLPFGILLCIITLFTRSLVPAIIIHSSMAVSFDSAGIFYQLKTFKPSLS